MDRWRIEGVGHRGKSFKSVKSMIAYELYWHDKSGEVHLLGILPERRKDPQRITEESIMNWGKRVLGNQADIGNIYFIRVEV